MIIPKQNGTKDTCHSYDEYQLLDFQIQNDLLTLGWIHTHPTQECFLSSIDLHTQLSYQLMLKEAIAIVVAPQYNPNFGIFNLTDIGITLLQQCDKTGFHPHTNAVGFYQRTEHVDLVWGINNFKVHDFR